MTSPICCTSELRFVCDMLAAVVKRKLGQCNIGNLIERRGTNVKDNLLKNTYNFYSLGEKSIQALPKNMLHCDNRLQDPGADPAQNLTGFKGVRKKF